MTEWNILTAIGIDPQLVTAGIAGGMVRALIGKQKIPDAIASMIVGAMVSNYAGTPLASALSSMEMFGVRVNLRPEVGGFFAGIFAYAIVLWVGGKLREKFGRNNEGGGGT